MERSKRTFLKNIGIGTLAAYTAQSIAQDNTVRNRPNKNFTLILGGGSARGFAHIGVLKALTENNIVPHTIIGTSAGALIGALYASGMSVKEIEHLALRTKEVDLVDFSSSRMGTITGNLLQNWVNKNVVKKTIEQFPIKFVALAADLKTWQPIYFKGGDPGLAVRASSAIPGVFVPVTYNNATLIDGSVISPMPARYARTLGAGFILSVDINTSVYSDTKPSGDMFGIVMQSFDIMLASLTELESRHSDVVLKPKVHDFQATDFSSRTPLIAAGYEEAIAQMPRIKAAVSRLS